MGLLKAAWMGDNQEKALKVVSKESSQVKLAEIAQNSPLEDVRVAAIIKIAALSRTNPVKKESIIAVENLTSQIALTIVAQKSYGTPLGDAAIAKLCDEQPFVEALIAKKDIEANCYILMHMPGIRSPRAVDVLFDNVAYAGLEAFGAAHLEWASLETLQYILSKKEPVKEILWKYTGWIGKIDREVLLAACKDIANPDRLKEIYRFFQIVDGSILKNGCEINQHLWEFSYTEKDKDREIPESYKVYRCKHCGIEKTESWIATMPNQQILE
ncbi:hypothetical protein LJC07_02385 [Christensenellaceae bacterium OttesenSCG-928-L17]|nr:hypothetical protein [Christensenellaceae bacterium OttesenSCG-928-L17]